MAVSWLCLTAGGYALGSVLFCKLIPQVFLHRNICAEHPDRNPGAANTFSSCGVLIGTICLLLELSKGFLPVYLAIYAMDIRDLWFAFVMAAPVLGHAWPIFHHFRGGKCIAVSFGVLLGLSTLYPLFLVFLAALYILFSTVCRIYPNSRRSIVTFVLFAGASAVYSYCIDVSFIGFGCLAVAVIVIVKHLLSERLTMENEDPVESAETSNT